ncbi:hypothetical protein PR202_ga05959 [Eleusine coracana subsp. coracana]|uniref:Auxin response factor n=1 Tax=Eleusine coracana subsp. coracana TaxID=191504 RepID=A0AAV5BW86_ELECO|nr:hypothetical protein PR202_ga05959 [Eleusine coracana subsp. coracana]
MTGIDLNDTVEEDEEEAEEVLAAAASNNSCSLSQQSRSSSAATGTPPPQPRPGGAAVCLELWHACAGPVAPLPRKGSVVVYLPQGHLQHIGDAAASGGGGSSPVHAAVPPHVFCRVVNVTLHADAATDEVYAQLALVAENEVRGRCTTPSTLDSIEFGFQLLILLPWVLASNACRRWRGACAAGPRTAVTPDGDAVKQRFVRMPHMFCKTLTASDTSTHGGFSVPRRAAEDCFPPLDYSQQRPSQELVAKDLHGTEWRFRHIYRGQPRRHLLTTGWSAFVNKKKLVSGDAVLFLRGDDGELRLGVRRAAQLKNGSAFPALYNQCSNLGTLANVAHAVATKGVFHIYYNPRLSHSEFIIPYSKFMRSFSQQFSPGMRFKMRYDSEDAAERRYTGIITGVGDAEPTWPASKWKCLMVRWDDDVDFRRSNRVSPWEVELTGSVSGSHLSTPNSKRLKPCLSHVNPDYLIPHGSGCHDFAESAQFHKVLQGQELLGYRTHDSTAVAAAQQCEARNMQYIDERGCSNDVSNTIPGAPRLGARAPLGNPGFSYHCSGFGESQRFQKVLQGQEVLSPYRGTQVDACMRTGGFHQQDGPLAPSVANKWHTQINGYVYRGPPASLLSSQYSSAPAVLMFQQGLPKMSQLEFGNGHLDKNGNSSCAMYGQTEGIGRAERMFTHRPHNVSGEIANGHLTMERLHSAIGIGKDGPDNQEVRTNSCKIFGISLAENVPARKDKDSGDASYPSPFQSLKQQVPKSLGNSCATVHEQRPVVGRVIDVSTMDMMI